MRRRLIVALSALVVALGWWARPAYAVICPDAMQVCVDNCPASNMDYCKQYTPPYCELVGASCSYWGGCGWHEDVLTCNLVNKN